MRDVRIIKSSGCPTVTTPPTAPLPRDTRAPTPSTPTPATAVRWVARLGPGLTAAVLGGLSGLAALALARWDEPVHGLALGAAALCGLLPGAVLGAWVGSLSRALVRADTEARACALTDPLTGLLHRHAFIQNTRAALDEARRSGDPISLVLLDIDRFKLVNDLRGQAAGDTVLLETAARLRAEVADPHHLARWGGEEFAVLLPGTDALAAAQHTDRLRAALRLPMPLQPGEPAQWVTASYGIASIHPPAEADLDTLLRLADDALYIAKHEGRDTVRAGRLG